MIKTKNLELLVIDRSFGEVIFNEFTEEIATYMFPQPPNDISGTYSFIDESMENTKNGKDLQLVGIEKDSGEFIGCFGVHGLNRKDPELGLWVKKGAHGKSYGIEAMEALIKWLRENSDFEYLRYPVDKRNTKSRRIPERNGGVIKKEYKDINPKGFELDLVEFWIWK